MKKPIAETPDAPKPKKPENFFGVRMSVELVSGTMTNPPDKAKELPEQGSK